VETLCLALIQHVLDPNQLIALHQVEVLRFAVLLSNKLAPKPVDYADNLILHLNKKFFAIRTYKKIEIVFSVFLEMC
jgi:hypothetical protein